MAIPRAVPKRRGDRDFATVLRALKVHGTVEEDPDESFEGEIWIRKDLSPPELRAKANGDTYKVALTKV